MTRHLASGAWLLFVWMALTGTTSIAGVLIGTVAAAALISYFHPAHGHAAPGTFRPWYAAQFVGFFAVRFVHANLEVALAVLRPRRIHRSRAVVAVPVAAVTETTTTLLANAVSLTPGTFILEMQHDPPVMYVHVLRLVSVRATRLDIIEMERRIVLAFGPAGASDRVAAVRASVLAGGE
jgi:multicomponent Na+:H+ antiporter subunit E